MTYNPWNPFTWPSFNGSKDNSIPIEFDTIAGQQAVLSLDTFEMGDKKHTHYPDSFNKYVRLHNEVFVIKNAVGKIAKLVSKAEFTSEGKNNKYVEKLENPNLKQSKQEFLTEFTVYLKSAGWTVIWKKYGSFGDVSTLELINLDPDKIDFLKGDKINVEYEGKPWELDLSDVILFYDSIRTKEGKGYSPLKPLRSQVNNILDGQIAKGIQIENSGTTIVSPKAANNQNVQDEGLNALVHPDVPNQITQKQQIELKLNNRGLKNRVVVASKGLDALNLSAELNSFKFDEVTEADKLDIYDAFNVPVELTPYGKNATYDNKMVAELSLLEKEVIPIAENLVNSLNSEFDMPEPLQVNFNHLDCMTVVENRIQETNGKKIEQVKSLMDMGLIGMPRAKELLNDIL